MIECDEFASPRGGAAFRWILFLSLKRSTGALLRSAGQTHNRDCKRNLGADFEGFVSGIGVMSPKSFRRGPKRDRKTKRLRQ